MDEGPGAGEETEAAAGRRSVLMEPNLHSIFFGGRPPSSSTRRSPRTRAPRLKTWGRPTSASSSHLKMMVDVRWLVAGRHARAAVSALSQGARLRGTGAEVYCPSPAATPLPSVFHSHFNSKIRTKVPLP